MTEDYANSPGLLCKSNLSLPEDLTLVVVGGTKMALVWEVLGCLEASWKLPEILSGLTHTVSALAPLLGTD